MDAFDKAVAPNCFLMDKDQKAECGNLRSIHGHQRPYATEYISLHQVTSQLPINTLGVNGVMNIGNSCFMNSILQCLSNTKLLSEYLRKDLYLKEINSSISCMKGEL